MRRRSALLLALMVACNDQNALGPTPASLSHRAAAAGAAASEPPGVTALTWNVYVGADIGRVIQARTAEEWAHVRATNFPARASVLAQAIAAQRPQLIGLEELAIYRTIDRPFEELATHVAYDFLALLLDTLHARGLDYSAAAVDRTTDIQVPVVVAFDPAGQPIFGGVRFTDGDAVLVHGGVLRANPRSGVYAAYLPVTVAG